MPFHCPERWKVSHRQQCVTTRRDVDAIGIVSLCPAALSIELMNFRATFARPWCKPILPPARCASYKGCRSTPHTRSTPSNGGRWDKAVVRNHLIDQSYLNGSFTAVGVAISPSRHFARSLCLNSYICFIA